MAFASDSTTAPAPQRGLLPLAFRLAPPVVDHRTAVEILDEFRRTIEAQEVEARPELRPEPLLLAEHAEHARAIHLRRRLEAAAEHGAELLAALGLLPTAALDNAIAVLDAIDGDPDIEDDGSAEAEPDELSLGWPEDFTACVEAACAADPDAELDDADLEDGDADEDYREPWPGGIVWPSVVDDVLQLHAAGMNP